MTRFVALTLLGLSTTAGAHELPEPVPAQKWRQVPQAALGATVGAAVLVGGFGLGYSAANCSVLDQCEWSNLQQGLWAGGVMITAVPLASAGIVHALAPADRRQASTFLRAWGAAATASVVPASLLIASSAVHGKRQPTSDVLLVGAAVTAITLPTAAAMVASWTAPRDLRIAVAPRLDGGAQLGVSGRF